MAFPFPKRRQAHQELDIFLEKMQEIISKKREVLANDTTIAKKKTSEKDLLTLMLEASHEGNGRLTDEELQVRYIKLSIDICMFSGYIMFKKY